MAAVGLAMVVGTPVAGADTVPYDATKTSIDLGTTTASATGEVVVDLTLPDDVTEPYDIIMAGIAAIPTDVDEPYSVIATVGDSLGGDVPELGLEAVGMAPGENAGVLLPAAVSDPTISASASGFRANTEVRVSVRYDLPSTAPVETTTTTVAAGGEDLPRTGSDSRSMATVGIVAVGVGAGLVAVAYARRRRLEEH
jgi:LPXTG-motif cell wall-anchored protein